MNDRPDESTDAEGSSSPTADDPVDVASPHRRPSSEDASEGPSDEEATSFESQGSGMRGRDVEVPMRVYKTVTVFSTLIAVVCVVGGFVVLDRATRRATLPLSEVDPVLAILGVVTILFGAAVYAFGTRFRAAGMGSSKNDDDEAADNG